MTLATAFLAGIDQAMRNWPVALHTLTDADLRAQREALRSSCEQTVGATPASLVLAALDAEIDRRAKGQKELPL